MKLDRSIRLWMKRLALEVHAHAVSWVAAANVRQEYITTVVRSTEYCSQIQQTLRFSLSGQGTEPLEHV